MNNKTIDTHHDLDDFDEEEKLVDPLVIAGFIAAFLSVVGIFAYHTLKLFLG